MFFFILITFKIIYSQDNGMCKFPCPFMRPDTYFEELKSFLERRNEKLILVEKQSQAYSNLVFSVTSDKNKYIFKKFSHDDRENEKEILKIINEPKIFEESDSYRIEQFIEHKKVNFERDYELIAGALANFHQLKPKIKLSFENLIDKYVKLNEKIFSNKKIDELNILIKELLIDNSINGLLHMDPQIGNLLKVNNSIKLIDFEYSCYGNIAIDINNIFFESMTNYEKDSILKEERGFNKDLKNKFIESYYNKNNLGITIEDFKEKIENVKELSHFLWYLWGRYQIFSNNKNSESFDYLSWTKCRLNGIKNEKYLNLVESLKKELEIFDGHKK